MLRLSLYRFNTLFKFVIEQTDSVFRAETACGVSDFVSNTPKFASKGKKCILFTAPQLNDLLNVHPI